MKHFFIGILCLLSWKMTGEIFVQHQDVILKFEIIQNKKIYDQSAYGEAPQFAIWLKNLKTQQIENLYVTYKTATGKFIGRSGVPVALPCWVGTMQDENQITGIPSPKNPLPNVDAISGPTPLESKIYQEIQVPEGSKWGYFIEVNVAGDYTATFPPYQESGEKDSYENGQPSIIYYGEIDAVPGAHSTPNLIGRTEQMYFDSTIKKDLKGILNAGEVFSDIRVHCTNIQN